MRALPASLEAERLILGCCLVEPEQQGAILGELAQEDFTLHAHQLIFDAMRECYQDLGYFERLHIAELLNNKGLLAMAGGPSALMSLDENTPQTINWAGYLRILKEKTALRKGIRSAEALIDQLFSEIRPTSELLQAASGIAGVLGEAEEATKSVRQIVDSCGLEGLYGAPESSEGARVPTAGLMQICPLARPGNLIVLAADTGGGKSSFARQWAIDVATQQHKGVFIASFEMIGPEIVAAMACTMAGVNGWAVANDRVGRAERERLARATGQLEESPIFIYDKGSCTVATLEAECRKVQAKLRARGMSLGLVIVDYLQLMQAGRRTVGDVERISEIARSLKNSAQVLEVPILALSQFRRKEQGTRPSPAEKLQMLKGAGEIEQAANMVWFIERMDKDGDGPPPPEIEVEIQVAKHRGGPLGRRPMMYRRWQTLFYERDGNDAGTIQSLLD